MPKPRPTILIDLSDILELSKKSILVKLRDNRIRRLPLYYRDGTDILFFVSGGVYVPQWLHRKLIDPDEKENNPHTH